PTGLTQPYAPISIRVAYWRSAAGPLVNAPGNMIYIFGPEPDSTPSWLTGVSVGDTIYIQGTTMSGADGTYPVAVTGLTPGTNVPYIGVVASSSQQIVTGTLSGATWQKTIAIVSLTAPVPNGLAQIGGNITIAGASNASWDGTYTIVG